MREGVLAPVFGMFFLSGAGALVFENLWFSRAGLIVGNTVWAAALVVGAFMAGLALGNALAIRLARRAANLLRLYAVAEIVAASAGIALVLAFPHLPALFRPLLAPFLDDAPALNALRIAIAFVLMVIPATALGTTLPLLSRPVERASGSYGVALGWLYGVNTLGAVAGTLLAELVLIPAIGLRGSGFVAAGCNFVAAMIAIRLAAHPALQAPAADGAGRAKLDWGGWRVAAAAFLAGGVLLALEVVWFRFLLLFQNGTTLIFAAMLAIVLAGIGLGSVAAAWWARRGWPAASAARIAAAAAAGAVVLGYAGTDTLFARLSEIDTGSAFPALVLSAFLMAPASLLSGVLFTALGTELRARLPDAATASGLLTAANTVGALAGSLAAAFVLLPVAGMERSFFILAAAYGAIVLVVPSAAPASWRAWAPIAVPVLALVLFPFGRMANEIYRRVEVRWDARIVEAREGIAETAFYLRHDFLGQPLNYRLATNAYSMAATSIHSHRYMKLFAFLPAAFHPKIERALLVCFGVGSTARALADLPDVKAIDVVDVSADILAMSAIAHPDPARHPLRDPRVSVHVEDGRFFLQQTRRRYDLITGEPPPPKIAGVASLYSREYFRLVREHLNPGGIATYWLPAAQLQPQEAIAIIGAFCSAFGDCSLWSGSDTEWVLMGSRDRAGPRPAPDLARPWASPQARAALHDIGIDDPAQLIAQFMAGPLTLSALAVRGAPLTDDFPRRISPRLPDPDRAPLYLALMEAKGRREYLLQSPWLRGLVPESVLEQAADRIGWSSVLDAALNPDMQRAGYNLWADAAFLLRSGAPAVRVQWLLGSEARMAEIAANARPDPLAAEHLMIDALAHRRPPSGPDPDRFAAMTAKGQLVAVFHQCVGGRPAEGRRLLERIPPDRRAGGPYQSLVSWAAQECKL